MTRKENLFQSSFLRCIIKSTSYSSTEGFCEQLSRQVSPTKIIGTCRGKHCLGMSYLEFLNTTAVNEFATVRHLCYPRVTHSASKNLLPTYS